MKRALPLAVAAACCSAVAGCGFDVQSPDDFLLTRTGQGSKLTLLVNDGGTIRCNGDKPRPISDTLLIHARDLADGLSNDAKRSLKIPSPPNSVYRYTVRLPSGTVSFPDTSAAHREELASAEQFTLQALAGPCAGTTG
jgi:hypothetical protein